MSTSNDILVEKAEAKNLITDSARNYLTAKLVLPLGNPNLKLLHTNQFLFTALPKEFELKNWETIGNALNSADTRFADYQVNRWYVESITTDVDVNGTAEMQVDVNAFASSTSKYSDDRKSFSKAYEDAINSKKSSTSTTSSSAKKKSNATKKNNTKLFASKAGRNVSTNITTAAKQITKDCNTEEQRAYCIYDWVDRYVSFEMYYNSKYSSSQVLSGKRANCWDTSHLIYNLCSACKPKVRCEIYNGYYHFLDGTYGHLWNKIPYKGKMTFADTGREGRNPIGNHGNGRYIVSGGNSPYRKNY